MPVTAAKKFLQAVEQDQKLQAKLESVQWLSTYVVAIAINKGYFFTESELEAAMQEKYGTVSEERLFYNTGGASTRHEKWMPPPGDVAGNSCFFTGRSG